MNFVHLHLHTQYSLLNGFAKIDSVIEKARKLNMPAIAITDFANMFGAVEFFKKAQKEGIKPIIGCEVYMQSNSDSRLNSLVLLCKNSKGYENLIRMVSSAYINHNFDRPRIENRLIDEFKQGLVCISGSRNSELFQTLLMGDYEKAKKIATRYRDIFKDDYYIEITNHGLRDEKIVNNLLVKLARELNIKLVATNDVFYTEKEEAQVYDVMLCIGNAKRLNDQDRPRLPNSEYYLKDENQMRQLFDFAPEAVDNTIEIAQKCDFKFEFRNYHLPKFSKDPNFDSKRYLHDLAIEGLKKRYENYEAYLDRLNMELGVIDSMGYNDYFLIVSDFVRYAKSKGIFVGPGRGSGCGSIVGYCIGITEVDPIKYNLIFERFLNVQRITMPDFDIDFEDERRNEVIDYVRNKYGENNIAHIITFDTFGSKSSIRDIARVMGFSIDEADRIAKLIPSSHMKIEEALSESQDLKNLILRDDRVAKLIGFAKNIEGLPRHVSTHAAGVVIANKRIDSIVPLYKHANTVLTHFNMNIIEELGLLKVDFLALKSLTVIKNTLENIYHETGKRFSLDEIDYEDKKTYELLSKGDTLGVFQLESYGMRALFRELKPSNIEDIIAGISLHRPGPMLSRSTYVRNKNNPNLIRYPHKLLENILEPTRGCMIYQEQVMQAVRSLAGYSYAQADIIRRAMSKKKRDEMIKQKEQFIYGNADIDGALKRGVPLEVANKIFEDMMAFADYAFNKSHSTAYAVISYQMAYLKTHFPKSFMAAVMTNTLSNAATTARKLGDFIEDAKNRGIEVLPIDINKSREGFSVEKNGIRFGLLAIKNVGKNLAKDTVIQARQEPFKDLDDYIRRMSYGVINKKAVEYLIKAGAFDYSGVTKRSMLLMYGPYIDEVTNRYRTVGVGQLDLFGEIETDNISKELEEYPKENLAEFEEEALGFYFKMHPLNKYEETIKGLGLDKLSDVVQFPEELLKVDNIRIIALNKECNIRGTRAGKDMARLTVVQGTYHMEVIVFPKTYEKVKDNLKYNELYIEAKVEIEEDKPRKLIAFDIRKAEDIPKIRVYINLMSFDDRKITMIKEITQKYSGDIDVVVCAEKKAFTLVGIGGKLCKEFISELKKKFGYANVIIK